MALHPLAAGFAEAADVYERGRPEHAPAVVAALAAELRLPSDAPVLDLAAGTGKLTRPLLSAGFDVIAVEPQPQLRETLGRSIGRARVRSGHAEAIPLPDASVAAVTVADAFHWFDQPAALAEIRRVLRPGGGLALLRAVRDWSGASWAPEVGALIVSTRPQHPAFDGPPWQDVVRAAGGWGEPRELQVTTAEPASPQQQVAYIASISWIAGMPREERERLIGRVSELVHAGETPAELPVHVTIGLTTPV